MIYTRLVVSSICSTIHNCVVDTPYLYYLTFINSIIYRTNTGEKLVNFMVEPKKGTKWPKELPRFKSRPDAIAVCKDLCGHQFMHRSEKVGKGELEVSYIYIMYCTLIVSIYCND